MLSAWTYFRYNDKVRMLPRCREVADLEGCREEVREEGW